MGGIRHTTLAYAAATGCEIFVRSMNEHATVKTSKAQSHHTGLDFILTFKNGKILKVFWDVYFRAHVLDDKDNEVEDIGDTEPVIISQKAIA